MNTFFMTFHQCDLCLHFLHKLLTAQYVVLMNQKLEISFAFLLTATALGSLCSTTVTG